MSPVKTRIFFVNRYFHPDESATSQLMCDLLFNLAARGNEVHVICSRQLYGQPHTRLAANENVRGVHIHRIWTTRFGRRHLVGRAFDYVSFYVTCLCSLFRHLRETDIVVAMTDPPLISLVAALAAKWRRARLINWLQDVFPEVASALGANPLPSKLDGLLRRWRDASMRAANLNVVLGSRMQEYFLERGMDPTTIRIVENWSDTDSVRPKPTAASKLRDELGLSGKFIVAYSGNLGRAHEYETMLEGAEALRNDDTVSFLFIGGGFNMEALKERVAARQLKLVRFLPYQPRESLEDSLAAADLHLVNLIPRLEGLIVPSKFYGILAAGRPVLFIGDIDGELARVVRATQCGFVIGPGRGLDLAAAIRKLRDDSAQRSTMGTTARRLAVDCYSATHAVDKWSELLRHCSSAA